MNWAISARLLIGVLGVMLCVGSAHADLYDIKFRLTKDVTVKSLQFEADYSGAGGEFVGSGGDVECETNSSINAIGAFNDKEVSDELLVGLMTVNGIDGPVRVVTCTFDASTEPDKSDFSVTVTDWSPSVTPDPVVTVSGVVAQ